MSKLHIPAHLELDLSSAHEEWVEADIQEAALLKNYLSLDSAETIKKKHTTSNSSASIQYYKTCTHPRLFIKIVPSIFRESQIKAINVSKWIQNNNNQIRLLNAVAVKHVPHNKSLLLIYPYIKHRFTHLDNTQISFIGSSLSHLHNALSNYPEKAKVNHSGLLVHQHLLELLDQIQADSSICLQGEEQILNAITNRYFNLLQDNAQMIHGDLHQGNILICKESQVPIFIDFEDSLQSWLTPSFDIAYIILRFILIHQDKTQCRSLIETLLRSYCRTCSTNNYPIYIEQIYDICLLSSVRAILLLHHHRSSIREDVFENEITKFTNLHKLTIASRELIQGVTL